MTETPRPARPETFGQYRERTSARRAADLAAERAAVKTARRRAFWVLAATLAGLAAAVWGLVR